MRCKVTFFGQRRSLANVQRALAAMGFRGWPKTRMAQLLEEFYEPYYAREDAAMARFAAYCEQPGVVAWNARREEPHHDDVVMGMLREAWDKTPRVMEPGKFYRTTADKDGIHVSEIGTWDKAAMSDVDIEAIKRHPGGTFVSGSMSNEEWKAMLEAPEKDPINFGLYGDKGNLNFQHPTTDEERFIAPKDPTP